jgi:hypothetical protein
MTARALLNPQAADHLRKLAGMFGSHHDGERAAAAKLADDFVRRLGLTWSDVIAVPEEWQAMAKFCTDLLHELNAREQDFIRGIAKLRRPPSDRQLDWLSDIHARLRRDIRERGDSW